jgi:hypothetical protein
LWPFLRIDTVSIGVDWAGEVACVRSVHWRWSLRCWRVVRPCVGASGLSRLEWELALLRCDRLRLVLVRL